MSIKMTAMSRKGDLGRREKALEWFRSMSPNAQYTAAADGRVNVITYRVASKYMALNFWGFHIACIISLCHQHTSYSLQQLTWKNIIIFLTTKKPAKFKEYFYVLLIFLLFVKKILNKKQLYLTCWKFKNIQCFFI